MAFWAGPILTPWLLFVDIHLKTLHYLYVSFSFFVIFLQKVFKGFTNCISGKSIAPVAWPILTQQIGRHSLEDVSYQISKLQLFGFVGRRFIFFLLPWQPEFCMEFNSLNNFQRLSPKEHSCEVWINWLRSL
jgi:hypothetical protein